MNKVEDFNWWTGAFGMVVAVVGFFIYWEMLPTATDSNHPSLTLDLLAVVAITSILLLCWSALRIIHQTGQTTE